MAFYLCEVIGDGASEETAFRPAIADHVSEWGILDGRQDATVATGWMLARCAVSAAAEADPRCKRVNQSRLAEFLAPDDGETEEPAIAKKLAKRLLITAMLPNGDDFGGLDTLVSAIPAAKRQRIVNRLQARGFDTSGLTLSMTIRDALRILIPQAPLNTGFCD